MRVLLARRAEFSPSALVRRLVAWLLIQRGPRLQLMRSAMTDGE